jgi:hypothetical protein
MAQLIQQSEEDENMYIAVEPGPDVTVGIGTIKDMEGRERPCVTIGDNTLVFDPQDVKDFLPILMQARSDDMGCEGQA